LDERRGARMLPGYFSKSSCCRSSSVQRACFSIMLFKVFRRKVSPGEENGTVTLRPSGCS
jgi:hypothetical protein